MISVEGKSEILWSIIKHSKTNKTSYELTLRKRYIQHFNFGERFGNKLQPENYGSPLVQVGKSCVGAIVPDIRADNVTQAKAIKEFVHIK